MADFKTLVRTERVRGDDQTVRLLNRAHGWTGAAELEPADQALTRVLQARGPFSGRRFDSLLRHPDEAVRIALVLHVVQIGQHRWAEGHALARSALQDAAGRGDLWAPYLDAVVAHLYVSGDEAKAVESNLKALEGPIAGASADDLEGARVFKSRVLHARIARHATDFTESRVEAYCLDVHLIKQMASNEVAAEWVLDRVGHAIVDHCLQPPDPDEAPGLGDAMVETTARVAERGWKAPTELLGRLVAASLHGDSEDNQKALSSRRWVRRRVAAVLAAARSADDVAALPDELIRGLPRDQRIELVMAPVLSARDRTALLKRLEPLGEGEWREEPFEFAARLAAAAAGVPGVAPYLRESMNIAALFNLLDADLSDRGRRPLLRRMLAVATGEATHNGEPAPPRLREKVIGTLIAGDHIDADVVLDLFRSTRDPQARLAVARVAELRRQPDVRQELFRCHDPRVFVELSFDATTEELPTIMDRLEDAGPEVRLAAFEALPDEVAAHLSPKLVLPALESTHPAVRERAMTVLGKLQGEPDSASGGDDA